MRARLKVYARIHEPAGYIIYRINREFVKRAPHAVRFVDYPEQADFQIVQCLGANSLTKIWNDKYVLFQYCLYTSDIESLAIWQAIFSQALMVVSYIDIPSVLKAANFNFHLTPWGVDTNIFYNYAQPRAKAILTTGWSRTQEAIVECYLAVRRSGKGMVNLGDDFNLGNGFTAFSRITDQELCKLYNDCEFVSGLRFKEGFEVSVIEGLACGCRPICFDLPIYKAWFGDLPQYVPHCRDSALVEKLEIILRYGTNPISEIEIQNVKDKFNWQTITDSFWKKIFEYV